jgi:serine/threonine-protein kinase
MGSYVLLHRLARGGMGDVHLAKQGGFAGIQRYCVVKTLKRKFSTDPEYVQRFVDEARVVVSLSHKNICPVFDVGRAEGRYYLAMEYIAGRDLRSILDEATKQNIEIPPALSIFILGEVLEALDYAHRATDPNTGEPLNLIHRDVSPQNFMVGIEGDVKLIDFGLAASTLKEQATQPHIVMGKLAYMPPEQLTGHDIDKRVDIFAAGVALYELLAGERYYEGLLAAQILPAASAGSYRPRKLDSFDPPLREILESALALNVDERANDCGELKDRLVRYSMSKQMTAGARDVRRLYERLFPNDKQQNRSLLARFAPERAPTEHKEGTEQIAVSNGAVAPDPSAVDGINELMGMSDDMMRAEAEQDLVVHDEILGGGVVADHARIEKPNVAPLTPAPRVPLPNTPLEPPPNTDEGTGPTGPRPAMQAVAKTPPPVEPTPPTTGEPVRLALKQVAPDEAKPGKTPEEARKLRPPQLDDESTQVITRPTLPATPEESGGRGRGGLFAAIAVVAVALVGVVVMQSGGGEPEESPITTPAPTVPDGAWDVGESEPVIAPAAQPPATEPATPKPPPADAPSVEPQKPTAEPKPTAAKPKPTANKPKPKPTATKPKWKPKPKPTAKAEPKKTPKLRAGAKPEAKIRFLDTFCRKKIQCGGKLVDDFRAMRVKDARTFWHRVDACVMMCAPGSLQ